MVRTLYTIDNRQGQVRYYVRQDGEVVTLWSKIRIPNTKEYQPYKPLYDVTGMSQSAIECGLEDGSYKNWSLHRSHPEKTRGIVQEKIPLKDDWNIVERYENKHVLQVLQEHKKANMLWVEVWVSRDGGYIDEAGFIRRK